MMENQKKRTSGQLRHKIDTRIGAAKYTELTALLKRSEHKNMSELLRDILHNREIRVITHDETFDQVILHLSAIRQELNKIGVNINQITHYFNASHEAERKLFYAMEVAGRYEKVSLVVESLLSEITKIGALWLPK